MSEVTEEGHCPPVLEEKPQDMATTAVSTIRHNLKKVADKVYAEYINASSVTRASKPPRLVAVSKTKPKEMIFAGNVVHYILISKQRYGTSKLKTHTNMSKTSYKHELAIQFKYHFTSPIPNSLIKAFSIFNFLL